jgi:hypothetical protein
MLTGEQRSTISAAIAIVVLVIVASLASWSGMRSASLAPLGHLHDNHRSNGEEGIYRYAPTKIRIRGVQLLKTVTIQYVVTNIGQTAAFIKSHTITMDYTPSKELGPQKEFPPGSPDTIRLDPGESQAITVDITGYDMGWALFSGDLNLRCIVEYEDGIKTKRHTAFAATYSDKCKRFVRSKDLKKNTRTKAGRHF